MALSTAELFKKAKKIEIASRRLVDEQLAGQYHAVFKGRGLIFSDVRPYYAGDDVRTIDWNITARMNAPHVKQFVEERDRTVNLVIDMSASNSWAELTAIFRRTRNAHQEHEGAKADLKKLVPEDAKEAIGHGLRAKRSKSGAVSFDLVDAETANAPLQ